ncbi:MAG: transporter substrate-binding domain-containing protein [Desulfobacterales bacterium]|nr:transporter substrate-binding domain-containing protein [Desulfobacterales bacterium]
MLDKLYIALFVSLSLTVLCHSEEKIVRVATLEDYAPFCMKTEPNITNDFMVKPGSDAKGFEGYCWDLLRESFHEMGYTIHLIVSPWARAMRNVKLGKADLLFPAGKNPEREQIFDYSAEPTNSANFLIYVRSGDEIEWTGLDGLGGRLIGVKRGFNYGGMWSSAAGIKIYNVGTIAMGFKMLSAGRIDGFLGYEYNWDYYLSREGTGHKFRKMPVFDTSHEYLVALKKNPNGKELLNVFDTGKKRLVRNGRLDAMRIRWFGAM